MIAGKRELCAAALSLLGTRPLLQGTRWRGLLVFNYHRVGRAGESVWDRALWSADADAFAEQVRFLKRHFDLVGPADLESLLSERRARGVMITFDDGYRDNYELAYPVLKAEGGTATFFITSGFLDERGVTWWDEIAWMVHTSQRTAVPPGPWTNEQLPLGDDREAVIVRLLRRFKQLEDGAATAFLDWLGEGTGRGRCPTEAAESTWMTWDMVRAMDRGGMSVGGHTVTHPVLANCSMAKQKWEIEESKRRIEAEVGHPISAFSYPVGQAHCFNAETRRLVQQAGYCWAFSFLPGYAAVGRFDRYALPRMAVGPQLRLPLFRCTAAIPQLFAR